MIKQYVNQLGRYTISVLVWCYRGTLAPFMSGHCRYVPTCSEYMLQAVARYGPWRGGWRGLKRLWRCRPFCRCGGYDPV